MTSSYEIRIVGILPPEALLDFEDLVASVEPVETVVHGQIRDQAALHGLLARLEMLGAQVLEVRRLHEQAKPDTPVFQVRLAPEPDEGDEEVVADSGPSGPSDPDPLTVAKPAHPGQQNPPRRRE